MSYDTDERSIELSEPIEIYEFVFPTLTLYRTSYLRDFVYDGNTYVATPMRRGQLAVVSSQDIPEMTVEMIITDTVVARYSGVGIPPQKCRVTIRRVQQSSGEARQVWSGYVSYCTHKGKTATFKVANAYDDPLRTEVPAVVVSRNCNHVLYDQQCRLIKSAFELSTTVVSFTGRTLTLASVGGNPTGTYDFGLLFHTVSGEWRTIIVQTGTVVELDTVLPTSLAATNAVKIYVGCDKTVATCRTKFNNVGNFGGHPHLTFSNFFLIDIRRVEGT